MNTETLLYGIDAPVLTSVSSNFKIIDMPQLVDKLMNTTWAINHSLGHVDGKIMRPHKKVETYYNEQIEALMDERRELGITSRSVIIRILDYLHSCAYIGDVEAIIKDNSIIDFHNVTKYISRLMEVTTTLKIDRRDKEKGIVLLPTLDYHLEMRYLEDEKETVNGKLTDSVFTKRLGNLHDNIRSTLTNKQ